LVASGVHEGCCLRDATKPDPMRVKRNVSAIINFQKFREEKIEAWATHGQRLVRSRVGPGCRTAASIVESRGCFSSSRGQVPGPGLIVSCAKVCLPAALQTELQHIKAQLEAERRDLEAQLQRER
jgi:hypothetical protein